MKKMENNLIENNFNETNLKDYFNKNLNFKMVELKHC